MLSFGLLASGFLTYSDTPQQADAVVLFVGPGFEERQQETCRLITEYHPNYLIIPAYNVVSDVDGKRISRIRRIKYSELASFKARKTQYYEPWFEDTHVEVVETKRLMEERGVRSALFVSSPYHLRRIKLISDHQFNTTQFSIRYVPTRTEAAALHPWHLNAAELRWQVSEFAKIAWYLLYKPFASAT